MIDLRNFLFTELIKKTGPHLSLVNRRGPSDKTSHQYKMIFVADRNPISSVVTK